MRGILTSAATSVLVVACLAIAGSASAASTDPVGRELKPTGRISLASQTPWVDGGGVFSMRIDITDVHRPDGLELRVSLHEAVTSRSQFAQTLDGSLLGDVVWRGPERTVAGIELDSGDAIPVTIELREPGATFEPGLAQLVGPGVHPLRVELRDLGTGEVVDAFTTHLVRSRDDDATALAVAWVQPLGAPPALTPDGSVELDDTARESLALTTRALVARPNPVTLVPTPETLDALAVADPEVLARLREAGGATQVVGGPYVDVDAGALLAAGLDDELGAQLERGRQALASTLGVTVDASTVVADIHDLASITVATTERLVAPEEAFAPLDQSLTLTSPFMVPTAEGVVEAVAVDPGLSEHFDADDPVLGAHQLLADLAVLAYDSPGRARGVVVRPPEGWVPSPEFLAPALDALASGPVVRPVTLDRFFDEVPRATAGGSDLARPLLVDRAPPPELPANEIRSLRQELASLSAMEEGDGHGLADIERLVLVASAEGLSHDQRRSYLDGARGSIDDRLGGVDILSSGSFRLTSRQAAIPVTLVNDLDAAMRVSLVLESDKLDFVEADNGATGTAAIPLVLQPGNTPVMVPVEARTSGEFPLLITVRSPDGRLDVAQARLTVRSTFLSGVGIGLSVGAGVFLCVWWARHGRTARRARRLVTSPG